MSNRDMRNCCRSLHRVLPALVLLAISCGAPVEDEDVLDVHYSELGDGALPSWLDPDGDGFPTDMEIQYATDPYNAASHPPDADGDKIPDAEDEDIDGDGTLNADDAFPFDAAETLDTDGDGTGNNADEDDDGDGFGDLLEAEVGTDPLDPADQPADLDGDGIPDSTDDDIDGDGVANGDDAFPEDKSESADADGDGQGNNADPDDDNDGYSDALEDE